jgi:uncharacterized membrane protein YphA (DoxX/SURF4 family)
MNTLQRLEHWGESHHPLWLEIVRIVLGVFLCYKGVQFAQESTLMTLMIGNIPFNSFLLLLLSHYILFAHIMGGFLLAMGMLTRLAALIQIPILLGAIIFVNLSPGALNQFSELLLSIAVLLLLIYFAIAGSGQWSFDYYMDRDKSAKA